MRHDLYVCVTICTWARVPSGKTALDCTIISIHYSTGILSSKESITTIHVEGPRHLSSLVMFNSEEEYISRTQLSSENIRNVFCWRRIAYFCMIVSSVALMIQKVGPTGLKGRDTPFGDDIKASIQRILKEGHRNTSNTDQSSDRHPIQKNLHLAETNNTVDSCSSQWTDDVLIGRCWGLTTSTAHPDIRNTVDGVEIQTADACKRICCKLGHKCVTWQYWAATKICKIGKHVRLGPEAGDSPRWCEPNAPQKWNGGKRDLTINPFNQSLTQKNFDCKWATLLPGQCFQLGPERKDAKDLRISAADCAKECCSNPNCWLWQHLPDRGCFYNGDFMSEEPFCDQYVGAYVGGRKKGIK